MGGKNSNMHTHIQPEKKLLFEQNFFSTYSCIKSAATMKIQTTKRTAYEPKSCLLTRIQTKGK